MFISALITRTAKVNRYKVECPCRKLFPGMILRAENELNLNLAASFLVSDKLSDI